MARMWTSASARQAEVLQLLAGGESMKEVAYAFKSEALTKPSTSAG